MIFRCGKDQKNQIMTTNIFILHQEIIKTYVMPIIRPGDVLTIGETPIAAILLGVGFIAASLLFAGVLLIAR